MKFVTYLLYARSNNSLVFEYNRTRFTNQYVVPYCPQLLLLFDCHINVKISARLGIAKYLSKYIYKSPNKVTMKISSKIQDEIKAHLDSWFISSIKAYWKIFEFNIYGELLVVQCLPIHLPNKYYVNFYIYQTVNEVLARQNIEKTQLTAWFDYNSIYDNSWALPTGSSLRNTKDKSWHLR